MSSRNGKRSINGESLQKVAEFMAGIDKLAQDTGVEMVGLVTLHYGGAEVGEIDCIEGSETVWST